MSYGLSASFGQLGWNGSYRDWMWAPVIGPWVAMGFANNEDEVIGSVLGGMLQAAGLTMFILGLTLQRTVRVAVYALDEADEQGPELSLDLLPAPGGGMLGATLTHF